MNPNQYCEEKAAPAGSSLYYSLLFTKDPQRKAALALHALHQEISSIGEDYSDMGVAQAKLAWWETEIKALFAKTAIHPVCQALLPLLELFSLDPSWFNTLLENTRKKIFKVSYKNFAAWENESRTMPSALPLVGARIFGSNNPKTLIALSDLDLAIRLVEQIDGLRAAIRQDRIELPLDELEEYGITWEDMNELKMSEGLRSLLKKQAARAKHFYQQAMTPLLENDRSTQLSSIILGRLMMALLNEIESKDYSVLHERIRLTPLRKLWIAWRSQRTLR